MRSLKRFATLFLVVILVLSAFSVFAGGAGEKGGQRPTIVLLMIGMETPYAPPYASNFQEIVNAAGMNLFMFNAKFDAQTQATQMDQAIAMRPALIVCFAADSQGIAPGIKKAFDAKIPVFMVNNPPVKESVPYTVAYAGPNNYQEGQAAGEMINEKLGGKGNIVLIEGLAGQDAQIQRAQGMIDKLKDFNANINVLARQTANWRKDLAVQVMQDFWTRYGKQIDLVYAEDDTLAVGASIALQEAGVAKGSIPIEGIGGSKEGLKAIDDGVMYGTVMQSPIVETNLEAKLAVKMVQDGIKAGDQLKSYFNYMDLPKVTKANVQKYLPGDW